MKKELLESLMLISIGADIIPGTDIPNHRCYW